MCSGSSAPSSIRPVSSGHVGGSRHGDAEGVGAIRHVGPTPVLDLRPEHDALLDEFQGIEHRDPDHGGGADRLEYGRGLEMRGRYHDQVAEPVLGADEFADDGADDGERGRYLQRREEIGQAIRHPQLAEDLRRIGPHGGEQVLEIGFRRLEALDGVHQHRKERDQHRGRDLRPPSGAEPQHQERRDGDDRRRLERDGEREQALLDGAEAHEQHRARRTRARWR